MELTEWTATLESELSEFVEVIWNKSLSWPLSRMRPETAGVAMGLSEVGFPEPILEPLVSDLSKLVGRPRSGSA